MTRREPAGERQPLPDFVREKLAPRLGPLRYIQLQGVMEGEPAWGLFLVPVRELLVGLRFWVDEGHPPRLYASHRVQPLYTPFPFSVGRELGEREWLGLLLFLPPPRWEYRPDDPQWTERLVTTIRREAAQFEDDLGTPAAFAERAIPHPAEYLDFPELLEAGAYTCCLVGRMRRASELLLEIEREALGEASERAARMRRLIEARPADAIRQLLEWRTATIDRLGLAPHAASVDRAYASDVRRWSAADLHSSDKAFRRD